MDIPAVTARDRGLCHGMRIQREIADPAHWRAALDAIKCPDERAVAREYLLAIYRRMRVAEAARARIAGRSDQQRVAAQLAHL